MQKIRNFFNSRHEDSTTFILNVQKIKNEFQNINK